MDLLQESHGFINDLAISFYSIGKDLNNGFTTEETISTEDKLLNFIKYNYVKKIKLITIALSFLSGLSKNKELLKNTAPYFLIISCC